MTMPSTLPTSLAQTLTRSGRILWLPLGERDVTRSVPDTGCEHGELLSLVFAVCLVLFLSKTLLAYVDLNNPDMPTRLCDDSQLITLGRISLCCAEDFAVGFACLLAAGLALSLSPHCWYRRLVRLFAHVAAGAALVLVAIDAQMFHIMRRFLTVSLFQLGGGFQPERSVRDYLTPTALLIVVLLPLLTLSLHLAGAAVFARWWRAAASFFCRPVVLAILIGVLAATSYAARHADFSRKNPDFAQNPHLLLARSYFWTVHFGDLDDSDPDWTDFLPGRPQPSVGLIDKRPTNIILIVLESGGSKYFSTYGFPLQTTPCLGRLQDKGVLFDNFYATANHTIASALPLFGSTYNKLNSIGTVVDHPEFPIPAASSWLRQRGYETCFLGSGGNHALENYRNLAPAFLHTGFDITRDPAHPFWQTCPDPSAFQKPEYLDDAMFADAKRYLRTTQGKKFFLMLWNYNTHLPFYDGGDSTAFDEQLFPAAVRADQEEKELFITYLRSLHFVDALIGDLYRELETMGLADDTLVVVTGDHGELFLQHGQIFHGHTLYEEELRVPLFLISPRIAHLGPQRSTLGSHIDLWPTLMDVCGLPANPLWQGRSLLGGAPTDERRAYFFRRSELGVREGNLKYIWDYEAQRDVLFDLDRDPGEQENIAAENEAYCKRQRLRLRDWTNYQAEMTQKRLKEAGR